MASLKSINVQQQHTAHTVDAHTSTRTARAHGQELGHDEASMYSRPASPSYTRAPQATSIAPLRLRLVHWLVHKCSDNRLFSHFFTFFTFEKSCLGSSPVCIPVTC
jgi:hypothetical protein